MGYSQNNPLPRMNSALKREKEEKRMGGMERKSSPVNNASQYGIQGVDELKYMPIVDDMHRKQDSPTYRHGSMKGDQSATHTDYANYKGTDKGYHGHDGSSHGDQSATHKDYLKGNGGIGRHASPLNGYNNYTDDDHIHPHGEGMSRYTEEKKNPTSRIASPLNETSGKGCAESEGGSGCIKKRGNEFVILNNKKGGIWKSGFSSKEDAMKTLAAYHANS